MPTSSTKGMILFVLPSIVLFLLASYIIYRLLFSVSFFHYLFLIPWDYVAIAILVLIFMAVVKTVE